MIRKLLWITTLVVILLAAPSQAQITIRMNEGTGVEKGSVRFTTSHAVNTITDLIDSCLSMTIFFEQSATSVVSLYSVDSTDNTVSLIELETVVNQFTGTSKFGPFNPAKPKIVFVVDTAETVESSIAYIHCSDIASSGSGSGASLTLSQTIPPQTEFLKLQADITDPEVFPLVMGIQLAPISANIEPDHSMGRAYNMTGPGGSVVNLYRHAFNDRYELCYKRADPGGTGGQTFCENNINVFPPDHSGTLTNLTGGFDAAAVVGADISFAGGGEGVVVAYNTISDEIEFRMTLWPPPSFSEQLTIGVETADFDGVAHIYLGGDTNHAWRPFISVWKVTDNLYTWNFRSLSDDIIPAPDLRMANGSVGIRWIDQVGGLNGTGASLSVAGPLGASSIPAALFRARNTGASETVLTQKSPVSVDFHIEYTGVNHNYQNGAAIRILQPNSTLGAGSTLATATAITILDQRLSTTNSSSDTIRILAQGCGGASSSCANGNHGNFTMRGGGWNNSHKVMGSGVSGTHFWQDFTAGRYRTKVLAPTSEGDGDAFTLDTTLTTECADFGDDSGLALSKLAAGRPYPITITSLSCVMGGTTPVITLALEECNSTGGSCVDGGVSLPCDGAIASDTSFTDAAFDAGDGWNWVTSGPSGTINYISGTVCFTRQVVQQ